MKLLQWFRRRTDRKPEQLEHTAPVGEADAYSGMRVEVMTQAGQLLFVAKLMALRGAEAELHQYSESAISQPEEPLPVWIRGYSDHERKAVYMEGMITPMPQSRWSVAGLKVHRAGNDRAFFRITTDLDATVTMFSGLAMGEKPCRLLNVSVGGACIASKERYHEGEKFLMKVRLLADRSESVMYSQVVRVVEKKDGQFEYGCQFLELTEADREQIIRNIFAIQRQQRSGG